MREPWCAGIDLFPSKDRVVESSLPYDRDRKDSLYAAAGIQEYSLVNFC